MVFISHGDSLPTVMHWEDNNFKDKRYPMQQMIVQGQYTSRAYLPVPQQLNIPGKHVTHISIKIIKVRRTLLEQEGSFLPKMSSCLIFSWFIVHGLYISFRWRTKIIAALLNVKRTECLLLLPWNQCGITILSHEPDCKSIMHRGVSDTHNSHPEQAQVQRGLETCAELHKSLGCRITSASSLFWKDTDLYLDNSWSKKAL